MKAYINKIFLIIGLGVMLIACEKDEIDLFSGNDVVYFKWAKEGTNKIGTYRIDSTSLSFAYDLPSVTDSIYTIPIKVQGYTSAVDREVTITVMSESTAQEDVHYSIPENIVIKADSTNGFIPVTFNRTPDLKEQEYLLKLQLVSNESFDTNLTGTTFSSNRNKLLSYNEFEITFSDILVEPDKWEGLSGWLGAFSPKKLYLLAEVNNMPVPNYNEYPPFAEFLSHVRVLKAHLAEQEANGTPVLEEDGSKMELGPYA